MAGRRSYPIPTHFYPPAPPAAAARTLVSRLAPYAGLVLLAVVALAVVAGPAFVPYRPNEARADQLLQPPSASHPLGTDSFGRDVLSRLLHGGRASIAAGVLVVACAGVIGVTLGVLAGYASGVTDLAISTLADILLAFPSLLLALLLAWLWGKGIDKAALALGIAGAPVYMRVARASVRRVRRQPFVRAAEAIGARPARVLLLHVLPNVAGPLLALAALDLGWAILHVSALSFLGVGVRPPDPEWGAMLAEARSYVRQAPWLGLAPGAAIALTVLGANLLGDAWQDGTGATRGRR